MHIVPVRVRINRSWSVSDLLQHVHTNHIRALPYETVDMDDLVAHCTDWAPDTMLQTVAQYQNVSVHQHFQFAGVDCSPHGYSFDHVPRELYALGVPDEHGVLSIDLSGPGSLVDDETATLLLNDLCEMIPRLAESPDEMATRLIEKA